MSVFPGFAHDIADAARTTYRALLAAHPDETFYTFALYTDSGAMTVVSSANSEEGLERARQQFNRGRDPHAPAPAWLIWSTAEWAYEAAEASAFNALSKRLADTVIGPAVPEAEFGAFFRALQLDMIEALRLLDQEGLFGTGAAREKFTLFISISDDDGADALESESATMLNPPAVAQRFIERYRKS
ncbi:DUF4303 domain-containing protein [Burkholderia sp. Ac-20379]|uniref:DUF4303 domain-containing protein n=1 Tax=Burkholderia sp. Ac-20379 TaxID=2703900 RepID=UPI00197E9EC5|nr:DUF4303 domain-containing protein [Burkholderia sp. Ac-20379]MBN3724791.1 DUF4303 domain-containing protein [Burkholderia sp. Ac-20379]